MEMNTSQQAATNGNTPTALTAEQRQEVKEQRNRLIDLQSQSTQAMDKLVLVLAGGALTVSLAFIQPSANQHPANPATMPYLAIAWISLIIALFAQLISHFASQYAKTTMDTEAPYWTRLPKSQFRVIKMLCIQNDHALSEHRGYYLLYCRYKSAHLVCLFKFSTITSTTHEMRLYEQRYTAGTNSRAKTSQTRRGYGTSTRSHTRRAKGYGTSYVYTPNNQRPPNKLNHLSNHNRVSISERGNPRISQ